MSAGTATKAHPALVRCYSTVLRRHVFADDMPVADARLVYAWQRETYEDTAPSFRVAVVGELPGGAVTATPGGWCAAAQRLLAKLAGVGT